MIDKPCFVYVIGHEHRTFGHAIKVGISENVASRLDQLRTGSCEQLTVFFTYKLPNRQAAKNVEFQFHARLDDMCIRGEWFGMPPDSAILLLSYLVTRELSSRYAQPDLSIARAASGLLDAFDRLDRLPDEFHEHWNQVWDERDPVTLQ